MTGQNDRQDESLTGQVGDQAGQCLLTGCYFQPCHKKCRSANLRVCKSAGLQVCSLRLSHTADFFSPQNSDDEYCTCTASQFT